MIAHLSLGSTLSPLTSSVRVVRDAIISFFALDRTTCNYIMTKAHSQDQEGNDNCKSYHGMSSSGPIVVLHHKRGRNVLSSRILAVHLQEKPLITQFDISDRRLRLTHGNSRVGRDDSLSVKLEHRL